MRTLFATILAGPRDAQKAEILDLAELVDPKVIEQVQREINDARTLDNFEKIKEYKEKLKDL